MPMTPFIGARSSMAGVRENSLLSRFDSMATSIVFSRV